MPPGGARRGVPTPYLPPTPGPDEDWSRDDPLLLRFLGRRLPPGARKEMEARLGALGRAAPREVDPHARLADAHPPALTPEGALAFHPSYARLQALAREHRVFTQAWHPLGELERGTRLATFALGYLYAQAECGYYCPACMTDGAAWVLERHAPDTLAPALVPRLVQDDPAGAYEGAMFLTEKTGGSDVGATTTTARPAGDGRTWLLTGDKWFASNAGADVTLTLARMPGAPAGTRGLGLFALPARLPDGSPNPGLRRVALKDKLGVRSMATAEVELRDAHAHLVAGEGKGFLAMADMVNLSRLYNAVASVGIARRALREAQRNGAWRQAFGKPLRAHPLYARAVAALANDVRGALLFVLDTADQIDRAAAGDERARRLLRGLTPMAKAMTARLAVDAASQACEALGGNGYVKPWITERLLRDAQVLPIWEGTTNVQALDFLRACGKDAAHQALLEDGLARLPSGSLLGDAWRAWAADVARERPPPEAELASLRLLERGWHLRVATLLAEDAGADDEGEARVHARAYETRRVRGDEAAFDGAVLAHGPLLAGWDAGA